MRILRATITAVFVLIPVGLFLWLLLIDIAPSGQREAHWSVDEISPFIGRFLPDQRVEQGEEGGEVYTRIFDEPVYTTISFPHTSFSTLELDVALRSHDQPIVEIGPLIDIQSQAFTLYPLYNAIIDALDWDTVSKGEYTLHQREPVYESVEAFVADPPDRSRIAVYHADIEAPFRLSSYEPLEQVQRFDVSLRGYHQYLTYIQDETFDLSVSWMDMNRTVGADEGEVRVRNENGEVVYRHYIDDDGNTRDDQLESSHQARIIVEDLPEGVYRVELSGTSDVFWRSFETAQRYMTFTQRLWIGDDVAYALEPRSTSFYTDAKYLSAMTRHAESLQEIVIGSDVLELDQTHQRVFHEVADSGIVRGYSPVGDVEIVGDGLYAFSREAFFDPLPTSLNAYTDIDRQEIDFVWTTYTSPKKQGEWMKATVQIPLEDLVDVRERKFALSVPGIDLHEGFVDIASVTLRFQKPSMTFLEVLSAIRERLPFGL